MRWLASMGLLVSACSTDVAALHLLSVEPSSGDEGATAAEVAAAAGMPVEAAAGYLVTLEVRGLVTREGGARYVPR